jgi:hypothetical protein
MVFAIDSAIGGNRALLVAADIQADADEGAGSDLFLERIH